LNGLFWVMPMYDESFRKILQFFNLSWSGYRRVRKGVKKRMARHIQESGCGKIEEYLAFLNKDPEAMRKARELLTVSISRFFRDLRLWEVMGKCLIPKLVRETDSTGSRPIRVWSAGCSCGEEVYSLKILWDQVAKRSSAMPFIDVWATDTNPEVLEKARIGIYPQSSLRNLTPSTLTDYFIPVSNGFAVSEKLKERIQWMNHDFVSDDPPGTDFDLIFLRNNLLTYYEPPIEIPAFLRILKALRTGGFLIIGNNEEIPIEEVPLKSCSEYKCIFEKKDMYMDERQAQVGIIDPQNCLKGSSSDTITQIINMSADKTCKFNRMSAEKFCHNFAKNGERHR